MILRSDLIRMLYLIGNILTILTMQRKPLITTVTSPCLICLAIVDTMVLNTGLLRLWIMQLTGGDIRLHSEITCKLHRLVTIYTCRAEAMIGQKKVLAMQVEVNVCIFDKLNNRFSQFFSYYFGVTLHYLLV